MFINYSVSNFAQGALKLKRGPDYMYMSLLRVVLQKQYVAVSKM